MNVLQHLVTLDATILIRGPYINILTEILHHRLAGRPGQSYKIIALNDVQCFGKPDYLPEHAPVFIFGY